jgi:hypothetical protein
VASTKGQIMLNEFAAGLLAVNMTREFSRSGFPDAPVVPERDRVSRRIRAARALHRLADRLDNTFDITIDPTAIRGRPRQA